jgi:threonine 3-dehydrogenase
MSSFANSLTNDGKLMWAVRKLHAAPGFHLVQVPIPTPAAHEVLIKILAASLCGTDLHVCDWEEPFSAGRLTPPITTGHETVGEIIELGSAVIGLEIGDLVSAESHIPCASQPRRSGLDPCNMCSTGNAHICEHIQFFSVDVDGFLAEFAVAPYNILWKNDKNSGMAPELMALQESLGNSVYTVQASNVENKSVAIFGLG